MKVARTRGGASTRAGLSREAITAGAIALADAEGLDAVTIRRLAQEHSVTPMALYWHFKDKDRLLDGVAERLLADVELPPPAGPWPERLRAVLDAFLASLRLHPELAGLVPGRILSSESGLTIAERTLAHLREAGFSPDEAAEISAYLLSGLVAMITTEPGRHHGSDDEAREDAIRVKTASLSALSPRRFPNLVASASALAACASPDSYYGLGVDMLVNGVVGTVAALRGRKPAEEQTE